MMRWKLEDLRPLVEHTLACEEHFPTFSEKDQGTTPKPALHWVKDEGIYLMSNGSPNLPRPDGREGSFVVYAEGFNPKERDRMEVWEDARAEVGGDDFSELIPLQSILDAMAAGRRYFCLTCTETEFRMTFPGKGKVHKYTMPGQPPKPRKLRKEQAEVEQLAEVMLKED